MPPNGGMGETAGALICTRGRMAQTNREIVAMPAPSAATATKMMRVAPITERNGSSIHIKNSHCLLNCARSLQVLHYETAR